MSTTSSLSGIPEMSDNVRVCVRMRPATTAESAWSVQADGTLQQLDAAGKAVTTYGIDRVFGEDATTHELFDVAVKDLITSVVDGYNATVFAYGQTAAGKTHTMLGSKGTPGVLPLAVNEIMESISRATHRAFLIRCSYIEIYKEQITDLLGKKTLEVHESKNKVVYVDAAEEVISTADDILAALGRGEEARHVGRTGMNDRSSRSHTIFRIAVESRVLNNDAAAEIDSDCSGMLVGTLNLVDLAGSESVRSTNAVGERLAEAKMINTSLLALSRVIKDLADSGRSLNYRSSKLTRVLQSSLSGNTKLAIIACINPARTYLEESKTTLEFAVNAKGIRVAAGVNAVVDDAGKMRALQKELAAVREQLRALQSVPAGAPRDSAENGASAVTDDDNKSSTTASLADPSALIAAYEAQLASMRSQMFIGGTAQRAVTEEGFVELGRARSAIIAERQAAMGRSKRHRETWCPSAAGSSGIPGGGGSAVLRKSFLADLRRAARGIDASKDAGVVDEESEGGDASDTSKGEDDGAPEIPTKSRRACDGIQAHAGEYAFDGDIVAEGATANETDVHSAALDRNSALAELRAHYDALLERNEEMEARLSQLEKENADIGESLAEARSAAVVATENAEAAGASSARWKAEYDELAEAFEAATADLGAAQAAAAATMLVVDQVRTESAAAMEVARVNGESALASARAEAAEAVSALAIVSAEREKATAELLIARNEGKAALDATHAEAAKERQSAVAAVNDAARVNALYQSSLQRIKELEERCASESDAAQEAQVAARTIAALQFKIAGLEDDAEESERLLESSSAALSEAQRVAAATATERDAVIESTSKTVNELLSKLAHAEVAAGNTSSEAAEQLSLLTAQVQVSTTGLNHATAVAEAATSLLSDLRTALGTRSGDCSGGDDASLSSTTILGCNINRFVEAWQETGGWPARFEALESSEADMTHPRGRIAAALRSAAEDILLELIDAGEAVTSASMRADYAQTALGAAEASRDSALSDVAAIQLALHESSEKTAAAVAVVQEAAEKAISDLSSRLEMASSALASEQARALTAEDSLAVAESARDKALDRVRSTEDMLAAKSHGGGMLTAYQQEISSLKCEAGLLEDALALTREEAAAARTCVDAANAKAEKLSDAVVSLTERLSEASKVEAELTARVNEINASLKTYIDREVAAQVSIDELNAAKDTASRLSSDLRTAEDALAAKMAIEDALRVAQSAKAALADENARLSLESTNFGNHISASNRRADALERDVISVRADLERRTLEVASLSASLERADAQLFTLRAELTAASTALAETRTAADAERREAAAALAAASFHSEAAHKDAAFAYCQIEEALAVARAECIELRDRLQTERCARERLGAMSAAFEGAIARERESLGSTLAVLEQERSQMAAMSARVASAEALAASRGADISGAEARITVLSGELSAALAEIDRLAARVERLNKAKLTESQVRRMLVLKREHEEMRGEVAQLRSEKSALSLQAAMAAASLSADGAAARSLAARASDAEARADAALRRVAELEAAASEAAGAAEDTAAALREAVEERGRAERSAIDARERVAAAAQTERRVSSLGAALDAALASAAALLSSGDIDHAPAWASSLISDSSVAWDVALDRTVTRAREAVGSLTARVVTAAAAATARNNEFVRHEAAAAERAAVLESDAIAARNDADAARAALDVARREAATLSSASAEARVRATEATRLASAADDRAAAAERVAADAVRAAADREREKIEATSERLRATTFLEKENLALHSELRGLRTMLAGAPAMLAAAAGGNGGGHGGIAGPRLSLAPRGGRVSLYGAPAPPQALSGPRASIAPSSLLPQNTGRVSTYVPRRAPAAPAALDSSFTGLFAAPPAAATTLRAPLGALGASVANAPRPQARAPDCNTSVGDLLTFPDATAGNPTPNAAAVHQPQECAQQ